jgi:hypothetical protein
VLFWGLVLRRIRRVDRDIVVTHIVRRGLAALGVVVLACSSVCVFFGFGLQVPWQMEELLHHPKDVLGALLAFSWVLFLFVLVLASPLFLLDALLDRDHRNLAVRLGQSLGIYGSSVRAAVAVAGGLFVLGSLLGSGLLYPDAWSQRLGQASLVHDISARVLGGWGEVRRRVADFIDFGRAREPKPTPHRLVVVLPEPALQAMASGSYSGRFDNMRRELAVLDNAPEAPIPYAMGLADRCRGFSVDLGLGSQDGGLRSGIGCKVLSHLSLVAPFVPGFVRLVRDVPLLSLLVPSRLLFAPDDLGRLEELEQSLVNLADSEAGGSFKLTLGEQGSHASKWRLSLGQLSRLLQNISFREAIFLPFGKQHSGVWEFGSALVLRQASLPKDEGVFSVYDVSGGRFLRFSEETPCHFVDVPGGDRFHKIRRHRAYSLWCLKKTASPAVTARQAPVASRRIRLAMFRNTLPLPLREGEQRASAEAWWFRSDGEDSKSEGALRGRRTGTTASPRAQTRGPARSDVPVAFALELVPSRISAPPSSVVAVDPVETWMSHLAALETLGADARQDLAQELLSRLEGSE